MSTNDRLLALLPDLAVLVKVVESGSFSAAARALNSPPSSVSRQISRLEAALKVQLFVRTTRTLRLTESGQAIVQHATDMLAAARAAVAVSEVRATPQGWVRLSAPKAFAKQVIQPVLGEFLRHYPEVNVQLIVTDRLTDLLQEDIDLAVRITDQPPEGFIAKALMPIEQVLVASSGYLQQRGTPQAPAELTQHDCIYLGEHANDNRWVLYQGETSHSVAVSGRFIANHTEIRLAAALDDWGIASLPHFTAQAALLDGRLTRVLPNWQLQTAYQGTAYLLYPPNRYLAPKVRGLVDWLVGGLCK
ncbi:LysR family transcriptional regulator [Deefgea sp. CFH1-16]|uniref:LysR family transcriptional regulator n=1 Tax=Deefgea sp. CFH1-16 TaxID=2675457 RepID=UPI0015F55470|nr:LysR family transcriptional regulator [Deefgea sp. CFH1-16]MBM5574273.1 LysR family transcriptional regulator [Deefgea sp. CFH1-16]